MCVTFFSVLATSLKELITCMFGKGKVLFLVYIYCFVSKIDASYMCGIFSHDKVYFVSKSVQGSFS